MQHMPDKEFDQLFRDKFSDAEIEPSANLWANIEQQITPKRKRTFPIYWMAAASIVVAITAMLVLQKTEKIQLRGAAAIADVTNADNKPEVLHENNMSANLPTKTFVANENNVASTKVSLINVSDNKGVKGNLKNNEEPVQPMLADGRLPIKQQELKPLDVAPIKEATVESPIVYAQVVVEQDLDENAINENNVEKKGIRNVGDLVNFVVDKVDKREKKLLRFNTDDDDNSSLVGINIGFLKFNKKDK